MIVYRCENKQMNGPYRAIDYRDAPTWLTAHNGCENHPTPFSDIPNRPSDNDGWQCAFATLDQLTSWFTPFERTELRKLGFKFYAFEAPTVRVGKYQCIFQRSDAARGEEITI